MAVEIDDGRSSMFDAYHVEFAIIRAVPGQASSFELRLKTKRVSPGFACSALPASKLARASASKSGALHCITEAPFNLTSKYPSMSSAFETTLGAAIRRHHPTLAVERSGSSDTPPQSISMCLNPPSLLFHSC